MSDKGAGGQVKIFFEEGVGGTTNDLRQGLDDIGQEVKQSLFGPTDPQQVAEAQKRRAEIQQKDAENAAAWRAHLAELARQQQGLAVQKQQKQQVQQAEAVQTNQQDQAKVVKKAENRKQLTAAELAARQREIKGGSIGG